MPTNTLPKKKRSILWILAGVFLVLLGVFFFQLFGPDPPIVVSQQTTYITEPMSRIGMPDFERYILERSREGVTPQDNAAALIWRALWPGELQPADYAAVAKELGLSRIPSKDEALEYVYAASNQKRVADWLKNSASDAADGGPPPLTGSTANGDEDSAVDSYGQNTLEGATEDVLEQAMSRPWTSEQIPPLAEWVRANQKPLDMLREASRRPRCYFPSTSFLNRERETLFAMLLSGQQSAREAARALSTRAMWHLGEGRTEEAWHDLLAAHRIARLMAQGPTLVEQLIAIAIDGIACDRTQTLIHRGNLSAEHLQWIRRDLAALPPFTGTAKTMDQLERLGTIDAIIHLAAPSNGNWEETMAIMGNDTGGLPLLHAVSVDWNLILRDVNKWYDRLADAANLASRPERQAAFDKIEADMERLVAENQRPMKLALSTVSRHQRSEVIAAMMIGMFLPAVSAATNAEDRANAVMQLTQLAAALAEHRAAHGEYPVKLDQLVPGVLDKLPLDIHTASPFIYRRDGDGYLVYSAGDNGKDDGGSNERMNILAGRSNDDDASQTVAETAQPLIPAGADDFSIRLPRQALELPKIPPQPAAP
jgi:hypothetical protein